MTPTWHRDRATPALALGPPGSWDDAHLFNPRTARVDGRWWLWYCGSTGGVDQRVFALGLATSDDGRRFERDGDAPLLALGGTRSLVTPTLLRDDAGAPLRIDGRLRFWCSSCDFPRGEIDHRLHALSSPDGRGEWQVEDLTLRDAYAPTVLREDGAYRMWFADTVDTAWSIRHARSADGRDWAVDPEPVLTLVVGGWERTRLNYPCVLRRGGAYHLWYSSRTNEPGQPAATAIGYARSADGLRWERSPAPVLAPEPAHPWEAGYTSDPWVAPDPAGRLRLWYSARSRDQAHKYFAIGSAVDRAAP